MVVAPLTFHPRVPRLDSIVTRHADSLARTIVRMAARGGEGDLLATLRAIDPAAAPVAIDEIASLYLFIAGRSADAFLEEDLVPTSARAAFRTELLERTAASLAVDTASSHGHFEELWDRRRDEYAACPRMYRQENEALDDTVIFRFYQNVLPLGREVALHVMANVEVPLLHVELSKTFGQLICEAMGLE